MNRVQEHLAQANGHLAQLTVQIVRQRIIVEYAVDTNQPSEMAESLLHALEQSLRAFEKHRDLVLDQLKRRPKRPDPSQIPAGRDLVTTPQVAGGRRDPTDQRRRLTLGSVEGDGCPKNDTHCRCRSGG